MRRLSRAPQNEDLGLGPTQSSQEVFHPSMVGGLIDDVSAKDITLF